MSYNLPPKGDVKRLPKWVQDYIAGLTSEIERQDNHIKKISSAHPGSNVVLHTRIGRPSVSLPPDSTVQFYLGDNRDEFNDLIEIHHNRINSGQLEVTAYGGSLLVLPVAANAVRLGKGNY